MFCFKHSTAKFSVSKYGCSGFMCTTFWPICHSKERVVAPWYVVSSLVSDRSLIELFSSSQCATTGICYPVCGIVYIKETLLLIKKCSPCGGSKCLLAIRVVRCHMFHAILSSIKCVGYIVK